MKILITGASGLIGTALREALVARGDQVIGVSRKPKSTPKEPLTEWIDWSQLQEGIDQAEVVVHLAGAGITKGRWTSKRKFVLRESRIETASKIVAAIQQSNNAPHTFVAGSAIGYYGPRGDEIVDENSDIGNGFLANLCKDWEAASLESNTRTVVARIGVVLSDRGGALPSMTVPFRLGLGGRIGNGKQWFSWIHIDDAIGLILHAIDTNIEGPLNLTAPEPITNLEMTSSLGQTLGRPTLMRVPGFILRLAVGEGASVMTTGQRVEAAKAKDSGYEFRFTDIKSCLIDLLN